jgi:hypothetical protein
MEAKHRAGPKEPRLEVFSYKSPFPQYNYAFLENGFSFMDNDDVN